MWHGFFLCGSQLHAKVKCSKANLCYGHKFFVAEKRTLLHITDSKKENAMLSSKSEMIIPNLDPSHAWSESKGAPLYGGPRSTQNIHDRKPTPQHIELLKLNLNKQIQKTFTPYGNCLIMSILKLKHVTYRKWMSHLFTNRHQRSVLKSALSTPGTENKHNSAVKPKHVTKTWQDNACINSLLIERVNLVIINVLGSVDEMSSRARAKGEDHTRQSTKNTPRYAPVSATSSIRPRSRKSRRNAP